MSIKDKKKRLFWTTFILIVFGIADFILSLIFISHPSDELNPIARFIIENGTLLNLLIFKLGSIFTVVSILHYIYHTKYSEFLIWLVLVYHALLYVWWLITVSLLL